MPLKRIIHHAIHEVFKNVLNEWVESEILIISDRTSLKLHVRGILLSPNFNEQRWGLGASI